MPGPRPVRTVGCALSERMGKKNKKDVDVSHKY